MGTNLIQLLSIAALEKEWLLRGAHEIFNATTIFLATY